MISFFNISYKKNFRVITFGLFLLISWTIMDKMLNQSFNKTKNFVSSTDMVTIRQTYNTNEVNNNVMDLSLNMDHQVGDNKRKQYASIVDVPHPIVTLTNCSAILEGNDLEITRAIQVQTNISTDSQADNKLLKLTGDCDAFLKERKYLLRPVNEEEESYPIAYSIVMFKDASQTERLLRSIYRPQNSYCIHVDLKRTGLIKQIFDNIAQCLENVFLASRLIKVTWGTFSVVETELICMNDLLKRPEPWHYFINACGQEFPIKTNLEVVRILKAFNGSNDIQGRSYEYVPQVLSRVKYGFNVSSRKKYLKHPFAYNINWAKGSVHVAVTRKFVEFLLHSQVAQDLIEYVKDTPYADEQLFQPLHFTPQFGAPGAYTGIPNIRHDPVRGISVIRYKIWIDTSKKYDQYRCHGYFEKLICIIALGDLKAVVNSNRLFVNKFHKDYHPLAYDCLEEYVFNNTLLDIKGVDRLNMTFYSNLDFVKNHI